MMDLTMDVMDTSGHTELHFAEDRIKVKWGPTIGKERRMIKKLILKAQEKGFQAFKDEDAKEPLKTLPTSLFGNMAKEGQLILRGKPADIRLIVNDLVEAEIAAGKVLMEAKKDGTWKIVKVEEFEPDGKEKKKVQLAEAPVGG